MAGEPLIEIRSTSDLARLQRELKAAGNTEITKRLRKVIVDATKPMKAKVKANTSRLPQSGGLAAKVAGARVSTLNRLSGKNIGVRVQMSSKDAGLMSLDKGKVRHKAFGRAGEWYEQDVAPGFFTDAAKETGEKARTAILAEAERIARDIESAH